MKKTILFIAAFMFSVNAFSQLSYGVKAGLNLASMTKVANSNMRVGYYIGAVAEYQLTDFFGVQGELLYSAQGVKFDGTMRVDDMEGMKIKGTDRFNYINIPILARFQLINNLSFDIGPQFGFVVAAKSKLDLVDHASEGFAKIDKDNYNGFDVSLVVGLSYNLTDHFDMSARYNFGMTNVSTASNFKNSVFQLGVGYRF